MDPIIIQGPEQSLIESSLADGGLPPIVGVQSFCVFRASKAVPEITEQKGWTYHHHVDMASWRGRLYVGWNSCERDEDVWPSRELYSTSVDGVSWTEPQEMFPQGVSTPLRMYFFHASSGRMLMIAGLRADQSNTDEEKKRGLVVREIRPDHSLSEIFTLQHPLANSPPIYESSRDADFIQACRDILDDRVFLEQQDRGRLLGSRKMKWHDPSNWPGGKVPGDSEKWVAGKAYSFFARSDGTLVGVSKMGWTTTSTDGGQNWSMPVVPTTLVTGKAKVWAQRTRDGRYALVYNPSARNRFPLVIVTSDDGITFRDMRVVHGELPRQRYPGLHRSVGPQYVRGISRWSDDGSRDENVIWLVYSMNKEDIWVSRVPLPARPDETRDLTEGFDDINLYVPKWASAKIENGEFRIENRDPYDYVRATRLFRESSSVSVEFDFIGDSIEVELLPKFGGARPVSLTIPSTDQWRTIQLKAPPTQSMFQRVSFRTGPSRNGGGIEPVDVESDRPKPPITCRIRNLRITTET